MYAKLLYFVGVICHIYSGTSASKAPFIRKCHASDPECIKQSAIAALPTFCEGIPELGVEPLDPLILKKIDASTPNLKLVLRDTRVVGLKNCIIHSIERDVQKSKIYITTECTVDFYGKYDIDGQILFLSLQGQGNAHFKLRKAEFDFACDISEKTGKDGLTYFNVKNSKYTYRLKDKADIDLENLFEGNEVLGRAARDLFRSSGNDVVLEVGPPMIKAVVDRLVGNIKKFFLAVPVDDLVIL